MSLRESVVRVTWWLWCAAWKWMCYTVVRTVNITER